GPDNPNVLRVRLNLAQAYMIQNKHADAVREANAIYPDFVTHLGPDHDLTMQVLTTRAQSEGALGMWNDAIRDDMAIHDLAFKKKDYATARKDLQLVTPVFSRPNAEAYEKHAVDSLTAELERVQKN